MRTIQIWKFNEINRNTKESPNRNEINLMHQVRSHVAGFTKKMDHTEIITSTLKTIEELEYSIN